MEEFEMIDDTMQGEEMGVSPDMSPEDAKAALGLATRLSEQFLMSQAPQQEMETEEVEETEEPEELDTEALKSEVVEEVKEEIKELIKEEIGSIRKDIQDALKED